MFNFFSRKTKDPIPFSFSTDIHCHIIPGVDDGSKDLATSVELVKKLRSWGVKRIFASPHVTQLTFENSPATIEGPFRQLKDELDAQGIDVALGHSAEYRIDDLFRKLLEDGKPLMLLPEDYILIENPFVQESWNIEQLVFDLQVSGKRPILVHPERYMYYNTKRQRYRDLHNAGLLFQINILSLAEAYGKQEKKLAEWMLKEGMVDFAGTDLHSLRHAGLIDRYLTTSDAQAHMADLAEVVRNDLAF